MSATGAPAGTIGKTFSLVFDPHFEQIGARMGLHGGDGLRQLPPRLSTQRYSIPLARAINPKSGVDHLGRRVAAVVESSCHWRTMPRKELLSRTIFTQTCDWKIGRQFLNGHLQPAVAREEDDLAVGSAQLGADGGREAEPHGSQTARRDDAAAAAEPEVAGGEHLLLPHVGDHHRVAVVGACHGVDRLAHAGCALRRDGSPAAPHARTRCGRRRGTPRSMRCGRAGGCVRSAAGACA